MADAEASSTHARQICQILKTSTSVRRTRPMARRLRRFRDVDQGSANLAISRATSTNFRRIRPRTQGIVGAGLANSGSRPSNFGRNYAILTRTLVSLGGFGQFRREFDQCEANSADSVANQANVERTLSMFGDFGRRACTNFPHSQVAVRARLDVLSLSAKRSGRRCPVAR